MLGGGLGSKSILDVPATLERLDTLGVPVVGFGTTTFPGFYVRDSGVQVGVVGGHARGGCTAFLAHRSLGRGGMLLANPIPAGAEMDPALHARVLADGPPRRPRDAGRRART